MDADVIVIGCGAAGLAAARSLGEGALRVIALEARDRIGGRVLSAPMGRAMVPAELGAEFIHGPARQTLELLRDAGTSAVESCGESWAWQDGALRRQDEDDFSPASELFERSRALGEDETVERFLERFAGDASLHRTTEAALAFVQGFDAADPAVASARAIADEWSSGVDSTIARPLGGYPPLFARLERLCDAARVRMHLSTVVRRISWQPGAVSVETTNGRRERRTLRARAAIVTLPVGVLRHGGDESEVVFNPGLPGAKRAALAGIEMGHVVKVVLSFRTPFWTRVHEGRYRDASFFRIEGQSFTAYWTQFPVTSELISAWAGGPAAIALRSLSQQELIERALTGFGAVLGEPVRTREEFESGLVHDWARDPYAYGAYSYVAVGGGNVRDVLAEPLADALFFAGEATSNDGQGGTVNGALETGERAAREAAAALAARASAG